MQNDFNKAFSEKETFCGSTKEKWNNLWYKMDNEDGVMGKCFV